MKAEKLGVYTPNSEFSRNKDPRVGDPREPQDMDPVKDLFFTLRGQHEFMYQDMPAIAPGKNVEFSKEACARKTGHRYYIRVNQRGELYNPLDSAHATHAGRFDNGLPVWRYLNVGYQSFKSYVMFLQTRNTNHLNWARREMGN